MTRSKNKENTQVTLIAGDRVSFLGEEVGIRDGVGGKPGKSRCVFGRRRRYTGIVTSTRPGTWEEGAKGHTWVRVKPDAHQLFDATTERDGITVGDDGTLEVFEPQASIKRV